MLLHISDSSKTWLPRHLTPRNMESTYTGKASELRVGCAWQAAAQAALQAALQAMLQAMLQFFDV